MMRLSIDLRLNLPSKPCVPKPMSSGSQRWRWRGDARKKHRCVRACVCVYQDLKKRKQNNARKLSTLKSEN